MVEGGPPELPENVVANVDVLAERRRVPRRDGENEADSANAN